LVRDKVLSITTNIDETNISDRSSFIVFVNTLREQLTTGDPTFINVNLVDFLDALNWYAEDIQGYYDKTVQVVNADVPSWKVFADLLKGASIYE
jgi:hypothetical protein